MSSQRIALIDAEVPCQATSYESAVKVWGWPWKSGWGSATLTLM